MAIQNTPRSLRVTVPPKARPLSAMTAKATGGAEAADAPLILLVGKTRDAEYRARQTKFRFELGQASSGDLAAVEAERDGLYDQLRAMRATVGEAAWRDHGIKLPPKAVEASKALKTLREAIGPLSSVAGIGGFFYFMSSGAALPAMIGFALFLSAGVMSYGLLNIFSGATRATTTLAPTKDDRDLHAPADPEAYKTMLIHLTANAKEGQAAVRELRARAARGEVDAAHVQVAERDLIGIYRDLEALRGSVTGARAADWKLRQGFDIDAAWKTYGMPVPKLSPLAGKAVPLTGVTRWGFAGGAAIAAMAWLVVGVGVGRMGALGRVGALAAEWVVGNRLAGFAIAGVTGLVGGAGAIGLLNRLVGFPNPGGPEDAPIT